MISTFQIISVINKVNLLPDLCNYNQHSAFTFNQPSQWASQYHFLTSFFLSQPCWNITAYAHNTFSIYCVSGLGLG